MKIKKQFPSSLDLPSGEESSHFAIRLEHSILLCKACPAEQVLEGFCGAHRAKSLAFVTFKSILTKHSAFLEVT